jgi:hypothetical protein
MRIPLGTPLQPRAARCATICLAAAAWALPFGAAAEEELARRQVVDKVVCAADPQQSYALYLPSGYSRTHPWPVLYLFDPSANGKRAVDTFKTAAETYGFILAGSNNSKNGPWGVSLAAAQAMWRDANRRFLLDEKRVYTSGWSGGARVATNIAQLIAGSVAGVIGCGAGFPEDKPPTKDIKFVYFGLIGNTDFNYWELRGVGQNLERLKLPYRIEVFVGPHQWPPEPYTLDALEWMRIREMDNGIAKDEKLIDTLLEKRRARAREEEAAGDLMAAHTEYAAIARDFAPLRDVSAAAARAVDLEKDARLKKQIAAEDKVLTAEKATLERIYQSLDGQRIEPQVLPLAALLRELHVEDLKKKAQPPDSDESRSATRLLTAIWVRSFFYLSQDAIERKDYNRAAYYLSVAVEIHPDWAISWYNRACAWALAGNRKRALEDLHSAVEKGYSDRTQMETDADLASLRGDERFQEILRGISDPPGSIARP